MHISRGSPSASSSTASGIVSTNNKRSVSGAAGKRYPSLTGVPVGVVSRLSPVPSSSYYQHLNHHNNPKRPTPPPMIFSRYPPDSPLVPRRRGHYSTSIAPSIENVSVNSVGGSKHHTSLSRRRSLSLDDLGRKEALAASHYNNNNNNANDYNTENEGSISNSNLNCDTDDDLDDMPSSFAEETNDDPNTNSLLKLDNNIVVQVATTGSSSVEPGENSSLSTIRESSPVHSVIEEWSPTPPNEDEPLAAAAAAEINQVIRHATSHPRLLDNNNQDPSKMTKSSHHHPIGLVHNYITKWKNKIKK